MIERVSHMMSKSQNHQWKWNSTSGMPCHWRTSSRNWLGGCTIWIVKFILRWNFTLCGWRLMSATWRDAKVSWDSSKKNRTVSCISISKGLWSSRWVCSKSANIDFREKSGNASSVTGSLGGKKLVGRQKNWEKNDMNWVNWPVEMHLTTCWKSTWEHHVWCTRVQHVDMSMSKGD